MSLKVLISAPYFQPVLNRYRRSLEMKGIELIVPPVKERLSEEELLEWITDVDGVISGNDSFTEKVLGSAPRLKVIAKWGTGVDSIDRNAAARLGIAVKNNPEAFTEPVADTVLAYVFCLARQVLWIDRDVRSGLWKKKICPVIRECTLGVIGVGHIGKAVVRRAHALGMRTIGNDIIEIPNDFLRETKLEMMTKDQLLKQCDFLSLNCDLNPTSFHLMGRREFGLLKPSANVINTSRGKVIDEPSLIDVLQRNKIAGAALDVFEDEPLPIDSPLRTYPNVLLSPHTANGNVAAWERVHENTVRNLLEGLGLGPGI